MRAGGAAPGTDKLQPMTNTAGKPLFAQQVKERRGALGLSQKELAQCAGCSIKTIEKIESGERRPSRQIAELLAMCLDVPGEERRAFLGLAREPLTPASDAPIPWSLPGALSLASLGALRSGTLASLRS